MSDRNVLSPAEWQSVGNSLIEASKRMEEAGRAALSAPSSKNTPQEQQLASRRNEKSKD